jgi:tetratricopeptide (TPR) repeat protein
MKISKHLIVLSLFASLLNACQSESKTEQKKDNSFNETIQTEQLDSIRTALEKAIPSVPIDLYRKAIAMHLQFADHHKDHDFAPTALDYAQGYYEQIQDLRSSIMVINRILKDYPDYKGKQMLMYNKATHHDFLRDTLEARIAYEEYLNEFPKISSSEKKEIQELIKLVPYTIDERIKMQAGK